MLLNDKLQYYSIFRTTRLVGYPIKLLYYVTIPYFNLKQWVSNYVNNLTINNPAMYLQEIFNIPRIP